MDWFEVKPTTQETISVHHKFWSFPVYFSIIHPIQIPGSVQTSCRCGRLFRNLRSRRTLSGCSKWVLSICQLPQLSTACQTQLIGLREILQENPIFHGKLYGFRFRFSHEKSTHCQNPFQKKNSHISDVLANLWIFSRSSEKNPLVMTFT